MSVLGLEDEVCDLGGIQISQNYWKNKEIRPKRRIQTIETLTKEKATLCAGQGRVAGDWDLNDTDKRLTFKL